MPTPDVTPVSREPIDDQVARALGVEIRPQPDVDWLDHPPPPAYSTDLNAAMDALERWRTAKPDRAFTMSMFPEGRVEVVVFDPNTGFHKSGPQKSIPAAICAAILEAAKEQS